MSRRHASIKSCSLLVSTALVLHEIGHTVGMRHSDYFDRSLSCGTGGNEGSAGVGAIYNNGTNPGFDPDSVMSSCYNANSSGVFSVFDQIALVVLY